MGVRGWKWCRKLGGGQGLGLGASHFCGYIPKSWGGCKTGSMTDTRSRREAPGGRASAREALCKRTGSTAELPGLCELLGRERGGGGVLWSGSALSESTLRWWGSCVFGFAWGAGMDCLHSLALNQTVEGWRPQTCNRALPAQLGLAKAELLQFILSWLTLPCSQAA